MKNVKIAMVVISILLLPIVAGCSNTNSVTEQKKTKPAPFTNIPPAPEKGAGAPDFK